MNKRGFLLAEETLKIILAAIAILFLVYFLFALYFSSISAEKLRQAESILKASLEKSIKITIERVRSSGTSESISVPNPTGWYVFGFISDPKPNSCTGKNCICICENVGKIVFNFWKSEEERQVQECGEKGACLVVEDLKNSFSKEIGKNTLDLMINFNGGIELR